MAFDPRLRLMLAQRWVGRLHVAVFVFFVEVLPRLH